MDEFNELLDRKISALLSGEPRTSAEETMPGLAAYERLAAQLIRVFVEESPSLWAHAQARQLRVLRAQALQRRAARRFNPGRILGAHLRWALVAAVALVVVLLADGITAASASSLPGSPLYPVKRFAEQSNVFFTPAAGERARMWMNLASTRLDEAQRLLSNDRDIQSTTLEAIDQSILYALSETAGTRGAERVELLEAITQLAMRQQTVLDELATKASPSERERFLQTRRLLDGVATLAGAAQSSSGAPRVPSPTPTITDSPIPTDTDSPMPTFTEIGLPTVASTQEITPTLVFTPTNPAGETPEAQKADTPQPQKTEAPEHQKNAEPGPQKTQPPEPQKTEPSEDQGGRGRDS